MARPGGWVGGWGGRRFGEGQKVEPRSSPWWLVLQGIVGKVGSGVGQSAGKGVLSGEGPCSWPPPLHPRAYRHPPGQLDLCQA